VGRKSGCRCDWREDRSFWRQTAVFVIGKVVVDGGYLASGMNC
jgi:hypothetical protein